MGADVEIKQKSYYLSDLRLLYRLVRIRRYKVETKAGRDYAWELAEQIKQKLRENGD